MAGSITCPYCLRLPERRRERAHRVLRCPLCKTEQGIARSGDSFRIAAATEPEPTRTTPLIAAALGILVVAVVTYAIWPRTPAAVRMSEAPRPSVAEELPA